MHDPMFLKRSEGDYLNLALHAINLDLNLNSNLDSDSDLDSDTFKSVLGIIKETDYVFTFPNSNNKFNLLHYLCCYSNSNENKYHISINTLLQNGWNVNKQTSNRWTALMLTAKYSKGSSEVIMRMLIDAGASLDTQTTKLGFTSLMLAAINSNGNLEAVQMLINAGGSLDIQTKKGCTALMYAAKCGSSKAVQMLINANASLDAQTRHGWTALKYAAKYGSSKAVQMLINANASLDLPIISKSYGWTALMHAAKAGNSETVQMLINAGASLDAQTIQGWTALMYAAKYCNSSNGSNGSSEAIIQMLLRAGANHTINNNNVETFIDLLSKNELKRKYQSDLIKWETRWLSKTVRVYKKTTDNVDNVVVTLPRDIWVRIRAEEAKLPRTNETDRQRKERIIPMTMSLIAKRNPAYQLLQHI